jgi:hypothetical protein
MRWRPYLVHLLTFLLALGMTFAMVILTHEYGGHSTPGIRIFVANCPGAIVAAWVSLLVGFGPTFYVVTVLANWAFYFYLIKGVTLLIRRFKS